MPVFGQFQGNDDLRSEGVIAYELGYRARPVDSFFWDVAAYFNDYSDLRGTAPETLSRERFVELRRAALQDLSTHHLSGNIEIQVDGAHGEVKVSMVIYRRSQGNEVLNTHCLYIFEVEKSHGQWTICSIVQKVYWSDGKTAIHPGIVKA